MATATISYTGPADGQASVTFTSVGTIPDAAAPAVFAAYRAMFGNYWDGSNVTKQSRAFRPGAGAQPYAVATDAQLFQAFAKFVADQAAGQATAHAQAQAAASVPAVTVTQAS